MKCHSVFVWMQFKLYWRLCATQFSQLSTKSVTLNQDHRNFLQGNVRMRKQIKTVILQQHLLIKTPS